MNRTKLLLLLVLAIGLGGCAAAITGGGGGTQGFALTVSPATASLPGTTQQQFTAAASDGSNPALTWSVNGVAGGSATTGTISATGLYVAPEFPPANNAIVITAAETSHSSKSGKANITLENPVPQIATVSPMSIAVGTFTLNLTGLHFAPGAIVYLGSTALTTNRISSTQITATGTATQAQVGSVNITVANPAPGAFSSSVITAEITATGTVVNVQPATVSVRVGTQQQFTANVTGNTDTGVSWSVNGIPGGNASVGTVTGNGNYTAPAVLPTPNTIQVTATSVADSTAFGNSGVTLQNPVPVLSAIAPNSISIGTFQITVTGSSFVNGAVISFGGQSLPTTFVSSTQLTATGTAVAGQVGSVPVTVVNPNPGTITSDALTALVTQPNSGISVSVQPATVTLRAGSVQTFAANVTGTTNMAVTWAVNNIPGGDTQLGIIDVNGNFTAPVNLPTPNPVTITAISVADSTKSGNAAASIQNPVPVLTSVAPGMIGPGAFQISLNGTGFVNTSTVTFGGQQLQTIYASPTLLTAIGNVSQTSGTIPITVSNPDPGAGTSGSVTVQITTNGTPVSPAAAVRFLEQASFGPNTESVNQVEELGFDVYLQNQIAAPITTYPVLNPATNPSTYNLQQPFFINAIWGGDQLRRRVSLALNELWVVAGDKVSDPVGYTNYLSTLDQDAFGNYYNLMKDVTLTPAMGNYLDMVNNNNPGNGQHANENYARELMQLFTLGLNQLNPDGSPVLDSSGNPVPTYTQNDVMALGLAFTGWTYPVMPGAAQRSNNPQYYGGPMIPVDANHNMGAKTLLGQNIPAGQSTTADLDSALTIIFNHPNVGPFVAQQLIERLVTSNPSPQYVQRVAQAFNTGTFNSYGTGNRGDMQATIAAILLDPEARRGDSPNTAVATDGKLREPIVMEASIARAFHAQTDAGGLPNEGSNMEQNVLFAPTVFNFFPPTNPIPGTTLNGPEFAIFDTSSSLARVNFIDDVVYGAVGGNTQFDLTPVINAGTPTQMLAWLNTLFLHGTMADNMQQNILTAINAVDPTDTKGQAKAAIYLVTSSSMYQVQY